MPVQSNLARLRSARLILWGNVVMLGAGIALFLVGALLVLQTGTQPHWIYLVFMPLLLVTALFALWWLKHSFSQAMQIYAWTALVLTSVMLGYDLLILEEFSVAVFAYHMGIFALGLVLGFYVALRYAVATTVVLVILGILSGRWGAMVLPIALAYGMTLPSWLVDRLETDLKRSEEKFSIVFRDSLDIILVLEAKSGMVLAVNQAIKSILDYEPQDIIEHPFASLLPAKPDFSLMHVCDMLATQESVFFSDMFLRADGSLCPMDLTAIHIPWGDAEPGQDDTAVLITLRDITARRKAEEELKRYRMHLEQLVDSRTAELQLRNHQLQEEITVRRRIEESLRQRTVELEARNADLDAFAHTVAHDLKSPLTAIMGFSSLIERRVREVPGNQLEYLAQMIVHSGERMGNIIDELLLLAKVQRLDEIEIQVLDMGEIVGATLDRLAYMCTEYQAEIVTPPVWPAAVGYAAWVEEVWANYVSNALKYGGRPDEGIPPRIELGYGEYPNRQLHIPVDGSDMQNPLLAETRGYACDPQILFWVQDNGPGIAPEDQIRLFTMFTQLDKSRGQGHGLGLAIVRRIVEKLGGQVWLESEVGRGSIFVFTLPAGEEAGAVC
ncbi:MAG: PAS domain S-box protein [Anaerolineae bacterium]|nr:PAS domain S-box protein [Anaerolineae bacterium]